MSFSDLSKETYIALETFRKNGTGVITPVWVTGNDGKLYAWTETRSWKVKRIRNNGRIRVVSSDVRGTPTGDWFDGQAQILDRPAEEKWMRKQLHRKYKMLYYIFALSSILRRAEHVVIEIAPA